MSDLPYAESLNYWKTSTARPDTWIGKTVKLIQSFGGTVIGEAFGSEQNTGRSAYMLAFTLQGDSFKIVWPVLPSRTKNERAARVQATTMLYYDIKTKLLSVAIFGARTVFFQNLLLPDGRTAAQVSIPDLLTGIPAMLSGPQLVEGEIVEEG
jgi:hypothetical protein